MLWRQISLVFGCVSHCVLTLMSQFTKLSATIFVELETVQEFLSVSSILAHINDSLWVGAKYKSEPGGYAWIVSNTIEFFHKSRRIR